MSAQDRYEQARAMALQMAEQAVPMQQHHEPGRREAGIDNYTSEERMEAMRRAVSESRLSPRAAPLMPAAAMLPPAAAMLPPAVSFAGAPPPAHQRPMLHGGSVGLAPAVPAAHRAATPATGRRFANLPDTSGGGSVGVAAAGYAPAANRAQSPVPLALRAPPAAPPAPTPVPVASAAQIWPPPAQQPVVQKQLEQVVAAPPAAQPVQVVQPQPQVVQPQPQVVQPQPQVVQPLPQVVQQQQVVQAQPEQVLPPPRQAVLQPVQLAQPVQSQQIVQRQPELPLPAAVQQLQLVQAQPEQVPPLQQPLSVQPLQIVQTQPEVAQPQPANVQQLQVVQTTQTAVQRQQYAPTQPHLMEEQQLQQLVLLPQQLPATMVRGSSVNLPAVQREASPKSPQRAAAVLNRASSTRRTPITMTPASTAAEPGQGNVVLRSGTPRSDERSFYAGLAGAKHLDLETEGPPSWPRNGLMMYLPGKEYGPEAKNAGMPPPSPSRSSSTNRPSMLFLDAEPEDSLPRFPSRPTSPPKTEAGTLASSPSAPSELTLASPSRSDFWASTPVKSDIMGSKAKEARDDSIEPFFRGRRPPAPSLLRRTSQQENASHQQEERRESGGGGTMGGGSSGSRAIVPPARDPPALVISAVAVQRSESLLRRRNSFGSPSTLARTQNGIRQSERLRRGSAALRSEREKAAAEAEHEHRQRQIEREAEIAAMRQRHLARDAAAAAAVAQLPKSPQRGGSSSSTRGLRRGGVPETSPRLSRLTSEQLDRHEESRATLMAEILKIRECIDRIQHNKQEWRLDWKMTPDAVTNDDLPGSQGFFVTPRTTESTSASGAGSLRGSGGSLGSQEAGLSSNGSSSHMEDTIVPRSLAKPVRSAPKLPSTLQADGLLRERLDPWHSMLARI
eukprot:TRINITY_DN24104_c0_g1_i1.p1 TRINITY_DN24104_c0_g1~~TRINITY_DN24104_c0_g1_i1.p1  ORF type:complete len:899 (-),score=227.54 TRINITY_DN24104_c0_g1_i1:248-2944(-)